ncbi:tetratricopeptide repeat protein [Roseibacillus ishigakijimensis]|uniref:Tetratricopeptide repeat protein n=2 Tax=Roseibacillus ishigakijimensis TaxID=454146 RepID=A0A934VLZ0_9BACT|nr:tetratricopeptide repeat protein [Roseibacillus ishigakijimensis]MBK1833717.1 tetratricopeptide repeat protein [Roseibacillus ishigakijimensis]
MSEESKSNATPSPAPLGEIEHGPSKFEQFMEKNLKLVILGALALIIAIAAYVISSQLADAKAQEAGNHLFAANDAQALAKVGQDYPDSAAAFSARLLRADELWQEGKEADAIKALQELSGADHPAAAQAKFSLASIYQRQGKEAEARSAYEAIVKDSNATYLHPLSLIALGDLAKAAGEDEKAKQYYQRKMDDYPAYPDQGLAVTRLTLVGVDEPLRVQPPAEAPGETSSDLEISPSFTTPVPAPTATPAPAVEVIPEEAPAEETPSPTPIESTEDQESAAPDEKAPEEAEAPAKESTESSDDDALPENGESLPDGE